MDAQGTIVYWTTSGGSALKGFSVGQESVVTVLTPSNTPGKCVGCHSSTPGGEFIGFSNSTSTNNGDPSHIEIRSGTNPAAQPSFLTADATTLLQRVSQELPVFSPAHWSTGDHVTVFMHADSTSASGQNTHLDWIDLEATSQTQGVGWGEFMRNGDPNPAVAYPFVSHDGTKIVYASAPAANPSGILQHGDLYTVAYGNRAGGAAAPVSGADTKTYSEFYPAYSPDDGLIAYTRLPDGQSSYDNPSSEFLIIGADGGTPIRHVANDPGICLGKTSPGITNSWPKWSPVGQHRQRPDLLLDHLLLDAQRGTRSSTWRPVIKGDETGLDLDDARPLPLEPAGGREQPHARLGHLLDSAQLRSGSSFQAYLGRGDLVRGSRTFAVVSRAPAPFRPC